MNTGLISLSCCTGNYLIHASSQLGWLPICQWNARAQRDAQRLAHISQSYEPPSQAETYFLPFLLSFLIVSRHLSLTPLSSRLSVFIFHSFISTNVRQRFCPASIDPQRKKKKERRGKKGLGGATWTMHKSALGNMRNGVCVKGRERWRREAIVFLIKWFSAQWTNPDDPRFSLFFFPIPRASLFNDVEQILLQLKNIAQTRWTREKVWGQSAHKGHSEEKGGTNLSHWLVSEYLECKLIY